MSQYRVSLERLKILLSVAETGSLTDAAAEMVMTVSAVSQQMRKLEQEMKVPLMERVPRGVRLTDAGVALARHAQRIDRDISAAMAEIDEFREAHRGSLRLATFPTFAASVMPEVIRRYRTEYSQIDIQVKSTRHESIIDSLIRRESELATLWDYPWLPIKHENLSFSILMTEPTMLLVPKDHRLSTRRSIKMQELKGEKWVTRENHPVSSVLETICNEAGFSPEVAMVTNDYQELQGMVAAGIGLALAPKLAVINPSSGVKVVSITSNPAPRRILLAHNKDVMLSPATLKAVDIFREVASEF